MPIHLNTQADLEEAIYALVRRDRRLKPILDAAGMPSLRRREPGFVGLAHIVCGQQLSTASASAIWARLTSAFDPFDHHACRRARADRLGRLGLSAAKIKTLKNLARALAEERLNLDVLAEEDADAAHHALTALHGIGPWTAQRQADGADCGALAAHEGSCGTSVVEFLPRRQETRGRDCELRRCESRFKTCCRKNAFRRANAGSKSGWNVPFNHAASPSIKMSCCSSRRSRH
jgi:hypothetical protein